MTNYLYYLSDLFHHLCAKAILLFATLLLEFIILIRKHKYSSSSLSTSSDSGPITTKQYLKIIEQRNPAVRYTNKGGSLRHVECTVCLSEFQEGEKVRYLNCNHTFHMDCLDTWLHQCRPTCPLCRTQVLPHDVVSNHRAGSSNFVENDSNQLPFLLSVLRGNYTVS